MPTFYSICNTFKDEVFQPAEDLKNFAKFWGLEIFFQNRYWHDYYSTFWKCFELLCWKNKCPPQELSKKSFTVFWVSWSFTEQSLNCLPFSIVYSFEWIYNKLSPCKMRDLLQLSLHKFLLVVLKGLSLLSTLIPHAFDFWFQLAVQIPHLWIFVGGRRGGCLFQHSVSNSTCLILRLSYFLLNFFDFTFHLLPQLRLCFTFKLQFERGKLLL